MKKEVVAIVVGGGPAPGINGVISAATIEAVNSGKEIIGIVGGFKSLFAGDKKCGIPLTIEKVSRIHTSGGSILKTSRDPIDSAKEKFKVLLNTLKSLNVRYLITIGGDGTAFMARWIWQAMFGSGFPAYICLIHISQLMAEKIQVSLQRT